MYLFTVLSDWLFISGYEKPFRLAVAAAEIPASVLVVVPFTRMLGAAFALGIMSGAIFFHLASPLGIDPYDDGGSLFKEACAVWLAAAFVLFVRRAEAIALITRLRHAGRAMPRAQWPIARARRTGRIKSRRVEPPNRPALIRR